MKHIGLLCAGLILAISMVIPLGVFASNTSNATYSGIIVVSNNSSATTNVATIMTLNTANMTSQGWISSNFSNVAITNSGADVPFMPSVNATYPWCIWVPTIGANTFLNNVLHTGGPDMSSTKYYFPGAGGMTTADNDTNLEPGDNFTFEVSGYINTDNGSSKNIIYKQGAFQVFVSPTVSQNITATISSSISIPSTKIKILARKWDGVVGYTNPNLDVDVYYGTGWHNIWSGVIADATWTELPIGSSQVVTNTRVKSNFAGGYALEINELAIYNTTNATWISPSSNDAPALWYSEAQAYDNNDVTRAYTFTASVYLQLTPATATSYLSVTAMGVVSSNHTLLVSGNTTHLAIAIDGTTQNSTAFGGITVDNSIYDWTSFQNDIMPYVEYQKIWINGELRQHIFWQYAATFSDNSTFGNDAFPTFRTASSDPDVSASLTTFTPVNLAIAPPYSVSGAADFITGNITMSGNFTSGNITPGAGVPGYGGLPGSAVIEAVALAGGTPSFWLWGILGGLIIAVGGLVISYMERHSGSGNGTLLLRLGWGIFVFGIMVTLGKFDMWMLVLYIFIALAPAMASRQYDIGASVGELNLIGFLSMAWIGLTTISRILEGQFITAAETAHLNNFMFTQEFTLLSMFKLPVLNFQFFTQGLPSLLKWDYAFFGGNAQIIQYMLYSLTAIMGFIVLMTVIGLTTSYFTRH